MSTTTQQAPRGVKIGQVLPMPGDDSKCAACEMPVHFAPATYEDDGSLYDAAAWYHDHGTGHDCPAYLTVVNLTPHEVVVDGHAIPASGQVARVADSTWQTEPLHLRSVAWAHYVSVYGSIEGVPEPAEGTIYIVSLLTLLLSTAAVRLRGDVFAPGPEIRDAAGVITGCKGLRSVASYAGDNSTTEHRSACLH